MDIHDLQVCPGTLAAGFSTYSSASLKSTFNRKKVSHILPYKSPETDDETADIFLKNREHLSISGVQKKISLIQEKNSLRLTEANERGTHILKTIPTDLKKANQVPANEHLTMQIARQVYSIATAQNALIFFSDGTPAYITKRFDIKKDGSKWSVEDFASLAGKTQDNAGPNFKYNYSYEELGLLIKQNIPAWRVEIEKFFKLVVFNYLFSNGDAHLKNFSIIESLSGDNILSPAYDLVNSHMHVDDRVFAFEKGLFANDFKSLHYKLKKHPGRDDFIEFSKRIGILPSRIDKLLHPFMERQNGVAELIDRSFFDHANRKTYLTSYNSRRNYLIAK